MEAADRRAAGGNIREKRDRHRAEQSAARLRGRRRQRRRSLPVGRCGCDLDESDGRYACVGTRLVFREDCGRPEESRRRIRAERRRPAIDRRGQDLWNMGHSRIARRRRLSSALDQSHRSEHHDRRQRSRRHHHPQRHRGDAAVELVAQSADRADLPRVG